MNYSFLPSSAQRIGGRRASLWSVVVIAAQRLFAGTTQIGSRTSEIGLCC
ncbi:MAG TPA: hypothetical protein VFE60_11325 [Roseiarcus sp.]|jgi:hypothetical protein|nr:hypothetical protein [Roseiarcus sp.]